MKQFHTKGRENSGNCACFPPAHEPPPHPPFGHPRPLGGGEGRGEGAVGWFKVARRAQSSGRSLLGERAGVRASVSSNPIFGVGGGQPIHLVTSVAAICRSRALSPAQEMDFSVWVSLPAAARAGKESPSAARTLPRR